MSKLIKLGKTPELHLILRDRGQFDFILHGDPVVITEMIKEAMNKDLQVAAAFATAVNIWAEEKGIPWDKVREISKGGKL